MWNPTPDDPAAEVERRIGLIGVLDANVPWLLETADFPFNHDIRQIYVLGDLEMAHDGDVARIQSFLESRDGFCSSQEPV
ncbi:hypothetical protein [Frondihabitans australicus]|uniref:Uncharacterized protein n=1 Tax=Frondihabitans australicus TaxID=386892 RepID=A0A495IFQ3_9MICO|nr:hypothetical protein [Frondihabitans australicus]RKR74764.1 hypothetical protein C8E83_1893 [Frondihabitans australicus]